MSYIKWDWLDEFVNPLQEAITSYKGKFSPEDLIGALYIRNNGLEEIPYTIIVADEGLAAAVDKLTAMMLLSPEEIKIWQERLSETVEKLYDIIAKQGHGNLMANVCIAEAGSRIFDTPWWKIYFDEERYYPQNAGGIPHQLTEQFKDNIIGELLQTHSRFYKVLSATQKIADGFLNLGRISFPYKSPNFDEKTLQKYQETILYIRQNGFGKI